MNSETNAKIKMIKNLGPKFFILRVLIGSLFVVIGITKIMEPYQNFLYVVQGYEILPAMLENIVARVFPWIELFLGLFLVLGLWLKWVLRAFVLMIMTFIGIISQALIRKLPLEYCGCFGGLFSSDIHHTLILDICLLLLTIVLLRGVVEYTSFWSLDKYFLKSEK
ncbi:MAG: DoxX family membrane protein [Candidatus Omnitrophica bacterium]|nr:DoxX family membrane protein [Candidatus Omnitrophota bacterium]